MYRLYESNGTNVLEISTKQDLLRFAGMIGPYSDQINYVFNFNGIIKIREGLISAKGFFDSFRALNCQIELPRSLISCEGMFKGCSSFNFPVDIPANVKNCKEMFAYCTAFNQPVVLPKNLSTCDKMFCYCDAFNQPLIIPSSVTNFNSVVKECKHMSSPIIIQSDATLEMLSPLLKSTKIKPNNIVTLHTDYEQMVLDHELYVKL